MPKKLTYDYVKKQIESVDGYKLLSTEYIDNRTKLLIQCDKEHEYEAIYNSFQNGKRCFICYGKRKYSYKYIKDYIESFGYKLLSTEYINSTTKLNIQCDKGHKYKAC